MNYALSLGYKANFRSFRGYTKDDIDCMTELVRHYKLEGKDPGKTTLNTERIQKEKRHVLMSPNDQLPRFTFGLQD